MGKTVVLFNASAGRQGDCESLLKRALESVGLAGALHVLTPAELAGFATRSLQAGTEIVAAAGGDGTTSTVAAAIVGTAATLGVIPAGTLNHFAHDVGIPQDLNAAAAVLVSGRVRHVDVGDINGRVFLNNCSIGLYPRMVRRREGQRERLGRGKWLAMLFAALAVFRRYPLVQVTLDVQGQVIRCKTPLVFVGNNRYETSLLNLGRRTALDRGELTVYLAKAPRRIDILRLMLRGLLGGLEQDKDFQSLSTTELTIETRKKRIRVALDGEVVRMRPPLVFRVLPGALRVIAP